jgi:hypothetical protein
MRFLHALVDLELVEVVDDAGKPIPRGTQLPRGTVPRYRVLVDCWSPALVDRLCTDPGWAARLELAWTALQLGAPDHLLGGWLRRRPAGAGHAAMRAWCTRTRSARRRRAEQEAAAIQEAIARRERGQNLSKAKESLDLFGQQLGAHCTPPVDGLTTVSRPTGRDGASGGKGGSGEGAPIARATRALKRTPRDDVWLQLDRQDVADRLADNLTEVGGLREEWMRLASALGEPHLEDGWRQARNIARRCGVTLAAVVGHYERAGDQVCCDISARVQAQQRAPVAARHTFTWGIVRRSLGLAPGRTCQARWTRTVQGGSPIQAVATTEATSIATAAAQGSPGDAHGGAPPPSADGEPPARPWTLGDLRAIRARAEAEHRANKQG